MTRPWTFEPFEADRAEVTDIYDPNLARIVATFYDADEARAYLKWRNKRQAKIAEKRNRSLVDDDGLC